MGLLSKIGLGLLGAPLGIPLIAGVAGAGLLGADALGGHGDPRRKLSKKEAKLARRRAKGKDTSKVERKIAQLKQRILDQKGGLAGLGGNLDPLPPIAPFNFDAQPASFAAPVQGAAIQGDPLTFGQAGASNAAEQVLYPVNDPRFNPFAPPLPAPAPAPNPGIGNFQANLPQFNAQAQGKFGVNPFADFNKKGFGGLGGLGR